MSDRRARERRYDKAKQEEYEKYWVAKKGEGARKFFEESKSNLKDWKAADFESAKNEFERLDQSMVEELKRKRRAAATEVQEIVVRHYALIQRFYKPTRASYAELGQMYTEHPDFKKRYDAVHPNLAEFWAEAMKVFAERELP